jgi:hypothetical protein
MQSKKVGGGMKRTHQYRVVFCFLPALYPSIKDTETESKAHTLSCLRQNERLPVFRSIEADKRPAAGYYNENVLMGKTCRHQTHLGEDI